MVPVFINGYLFYFEPETKKVFDLDKKSFTTWNFVTYQEREQIRRQLTLDSASEYYKERILKYTHDGNLQRIKGTASRNG